MISRFSAFAVGDIAHNRGTFVSILRLKLRQKFQFEHLLVDIQLQRKISPPKCEFIPRINDCNE